MTDTAEQKALERIAELEAAAEEHRRTIEILQGEVIAKTAEINESERSCGISMAGEIGVRTQLASQAAEIEGLRGDAARWRYLDTGAWAVTGSRLNNLLNSWNKLGGGIMGEASLAEMLDTRAPRPGEQG